MQEFSKEATSACTIELLAIHNYDIKCTYSSRMTSIITVTTGQYKRPQVQRKTALFPH
jgi:hypothetical protein